MTWPTPADVTVAEVKPECGGDLKRAFSFISGYVKCLSPDAVIINLGCNNARNAIDLARAYNRRVYAVAGL